MRCLIIEDDIAAQKLLTLLLSDYADCTVAADGQEGMEYFVMALCDENPYDLICLDIMMPHQGGHETLQQIRRIEQGRGIRGLDGAKVIMTTVLHDRMNIMSAFQEGCGAYLIKPIHRSALLREMEKLGLLTASHR